MQGASMADMFFGQRLVVGVGDLMTSCDAQAVLSTYSLGSCIGVVAFDARAQVGGILHVMLPSSTIAPGKAEAQPAMFVDTGLELFLRTLGAQGAERGQTRFVVAGGASVISGHDPFRIGERNSAAALDLLGRSGCGVLHADVGGIVNRALHLEMGAGLVTITTPQKGSRISLAP
jgi:chemotaxis protein CheD